MSAQPTRRLSEPARRRRPLQERNETATFIKALAPWKTLLNTLPTALESTTDQRRRDPGERPARAAQGAATGSRGRARGDRPGLEPQRNSAVDNHAAATVGGGGRVRRRPVRLRDGGHAGRLRPLRDARLGR